MPENALRSYNRYLQGDRDALDILVRTYSDALVRYAYCYLNDSAASEDVMEETIATLIFRHRHFADADHFNAYLYRVARNKSIDLLRRRGREVPLSDVEHVLQSGGVERSVLQRERNAALYRCMQQLPAQYREVIYLTYFEDFQTEVICRIMKKSRKQVYNLHARAKTALRELLEKEGVSHEDL